MKFLYEGDGEQHVILTDRDDYSIEEMFDYFLRLMVCAGYTPQEIDNILSEDEDL